MLSEMLIKVLKIQTTEYDANKWTKNDIGKNWYVMQDCEMKRQKIQPVLETNQNLQVKKVMHWITETVMNQR